MTLEAENENGSFLGASLRLLLLLLLVFFCKHIYFGLQKGSPSCNNSAPKGVVGRGSLSLSPSSVSLSLQNQTGIYYIIN